jgi:hypothetical protein
MESFISKALGMLVLATVLHAQRIDIKPLDFQPLTSLPWKDNPEASLDEHLKRIFHESDSEIRYPVLAAYLRWIPVADLEAAFDLCLHLEGTQCPQGLVAYFLPIWAERSPHTAWKRVEPLFQLQEHHWLNYDRWENEKIAFRDLAAMRKSSFWMDPRWLENFLAGLKQSQVPAAEKAALRSAFMTRWSPIYDSPPSEHPTADRRGYDLEAAGLLEAFDIASENIPMEIHRFIQEKQTAALKVLMRRWLVWKPEKALLIAAMTEKSDDLPFEFFLCWLRHAPETLIEWVEARLSFNNPSFRVMGMVLSQVDSKRRQSWMNQVKASDSNLESIASLFSAWAPWDPHSAMEAAIKARDPYLISQTTSAIVYGFSLGTPNMALYDLSVVRDFDLSRLPKKDRGLMFEDWYILMERWGYIDIGESARYGLDFMLKTGYAPRENLIKLFSGDDAFSSDSDMIDRTFCALRMWAVLRPEPMKAWIATQPDADMRKALTWLLEHPWGTGEH